MLRKPKPLYAVYLLAIADQHMLGKKNAIIVLRYVFGSVYFMALYLLNIWMDLIETMLIDLKSVLFHPT